MPVFVDVSQMSDLEVKRMGQIDEEDDTPPSWNRGRNRATSTRVVVKSTKYSVSDVWAAACAANRINGGYHKESVYEWNEVEGINKLVLRKNREIMMEFLANPDRLLVEDVEAGEQCLGFLQNDLTFRTLKGKTNDFDRSVRQVLAVQDHFNSIGNRYELAVVACLPASWKRATERQNKDERLADCRGGFVGAVGDHVMFDIEVISCGKSKEFPIYWITAINDADQPVMFSNKEAWDVGTHLTIKGKVKAHVQRTNLTQLNYVKVL